MLSTSSAPTTDRTNPEGSSPPEVSGPDARTRASTKAAVTRRLHKDAHRAERLADIREQIESGELVVRQMTTAQMEEARRSL